MTATLRHVIVYNAVFGAGGLGTFDEVATETSLPSGRPNAQGFWPASWYQLV